ncbi:MAG: hypothetical protein U0T83_10360 [Bacteriovoracaceae bacterium]
MFKLIIIYFFTITTLLANEVDNFSNRYEKLESSTYAFNLELNRRIEIAIKNANAISKNKNECNDDVFYKQLKGQLVQLFYSKFELYVIFNGSIPKLFAPKKSIYSYFHVLSTDPSGANLFFSLSPVFNVNGVLVGGDKLSHFFTEGWNYFKIKNFEGKGTRGALDYGEKMERGILGLIPSGVYSYADLVANYQGMLFWERVINSKKIIKPIKNNNRPYVICENNQWRQIQKADFSDYVDMGFDEGINCSNFRTENLKNAFEKRIKELEIETQKNMTCPIMKSHCKYLSNKYKNKAIDLLHPKCRI